MSQQETERRIRQLDNDVQSIYVLLSAIQGTQTRHSNRFEEQAQKLDTLETKVGDLDTKVDALDTKVGDLDTKMDSVLELLRDR